MTFHLARPARTTGAAVLLAAVALCAGCSLLKTQAASQAPARHRAPAAAAAASSSPPVGSVVRPQAAILPFSPTRLQAAAALAARFAAGYDTWSWRQPPAAWLAALRPMTTSGLYAALAHGADIPGVLTQRDATRQAARGTAAGVQIRDLTPGSVTVIVTVRQLITSTSGTTRTAVSFAVTLTPRRGSWAVYDIEPASAGNS